MNPLPRSAARQAGFTLLELMITMAILMPILGVVLSSSEVAMNSMRTSEAAAQAIENVQRISQRVAQVLRPAVLSTYRMAADQSDVDMGLATTVGEFIDPVDLAARSAIQFRSASGVLSMNAASVTSVRTLAFRRESTEQANGVDDDRDGMVDEGDVVMTYNGTDIVLGRCLELCTMTLEDSKITIRLRAAVRRGDGTIQRGLTILALTLRNN